MGEECLRPKCIRNRKLFWSTDILIGNFLDIRTNVTGNYPGKYNYHRPTSAKSTRPMSNLTVPSTPSLS